MNSLGTRRALEHELEWKIPDGASKFETWRSSSARYALGARYELVPNICEYGSRFSIWRRNIPTGRSGEAKDTSRTVGALSFQEVVCLSVATPAPPPLNVLLSI